MGCTPDTIRELDPTTLSGPAIPLCDTLRSRQTACVEPLGVLIESLVPPRDPDTNVDGNTEFGDGVDDAKRVYYAWTGSNGADFDKDSTTFSEVMVTTDPGIEAVEWSTSKAKHSQHLL